MGSRYVVESTITVCYCGNHVGSEAAASLLLRGVKEEEMPISLHALVWGRGVYRIHSLDKSLHLYHLGSLLIFAGKLCMH